MIKRLLCAAAAALSLAVGIAAIADHQVLGQALPYTAGPWVPMGYNGLIAGSCGVTSGTLTQSGTSDLKTFASNNLGSQAIGSLGPAFPGTYYVEVTRNAGTSAGTFSMDSGIGVCQNIATTANVWANWTKGAGIGFNGWLTMNGSAVNSGLGNITTGNTQGIAIDTRNTVPGVSSTRGHFYWQNSVGGGQWVTGNPQFAPSYGTNTGAGSFSALMPYLPPQAWDLDVIFKTSAVESFTVNSGGAAFVFKVPPGYAPGWGKQVPNVLTYLGWDRTTGDTNAAAWGPHDVAFQGKGARSQTSYAASGKRYFEFSVSQLVDNGSWYGVTDASQTVFAASCGGTPHCFAMNALGTGNVGGSIQNNQVGQGAVDLGGKKLWLRGKNADNWNNTVGADPATGVGGVDISAMTFPIFIGAGAPSNGFDAILINNPYYMTYSAPSGFTAGW